MFNTAPGTQQVLNKCYLLLFYHGDQPKGGSAQGEDLRPLAMATSFISEKNPKSNAPPSVPLYPPATGQNLSA